MPRTNENNNNNVSNKQKQKKWNSTKAIPIQHSVQMRACYQIAGLRGKKLEQQFPQYARSTIYKHVNMPINDITPHDKRRRNTGRVEKMSSRDKRILRRTLLTLRKDIGHFTSRRVHLESGLEHVSNRTIRRQINKLGFYYLRSRKKGLLSVKDLKLRRKFCRKITRRRLGPEFCRHGISLYLDCTGFVYKKNPMDQATAPTARKWRRINEGLQIGCTARGSKEGVRQARFIVAIAYDKGVILCKQYFGRLSGNTMADIAREHFPSMFERSANPREKQFLQDGCPIQNSVAAKRVYDEIGALVFCIPPRSPDLNPIENVFHLVNMEIRKDTIKRNITEETFPSFSQRVKRLIQRIPKRTINHVIDSMDKRIKMVLRAKGNRIKY